MDSKKSNKEGGVQVFNHRFTIDRNFTNLVASLCTEKDENKGIDEMIYCITHNLITNGEQYFKNHEDYECKVVRLKEQTLKFLPCTTNLISTCDIFEFLDFINSIRKDNCYAELNTDYCKAKTGLFLNITEYHRFLMDLPYVCFKDPCAYEKRVKRGYGLIKKMNSYCKLNNIPQKFCQAGKAVGTSKNNNFALDLITLNKIITPRH